MMPPGESDADLLARVRAGDDGALGALLARHEGELFRFLLGLLRDRHRAEDALQETFVQAIRHAHRADPAKFRGWLFTVGHQQAMLLLRREKRWPTAAGDAIGATADPAPDPAEVAALAAEREAMRGLLAQLPDGQQAVIRLRLEDGLKFREVADRLGVPLNTALGRMHDGLRRLREFWEGRGHDG